MSPIIREPDSDSDAAKIPQLIEMHETVKKSNVPNFQGCRIPLVSNWNCEYLEENLVEYDDKQVVDFVKFGWPIGLVETEFKQCRPPKNHRSATDYSEEMDRYIAREVAEGTLLGPCISNPFQAPAKISPLSTT